MTAGIRWERPTGLPSEHLELLQLPGRQSQQSECPHSPATVVLRERSSSPTQQFKTVRPNQGHLFPVPPVVQATRSTISITAVQKVIPASQTGHHMEFTCCTEEQPRRPYQSPAGFRNSGGSALRWQILTSSVHVDGVTTRPDNSDDSTKHKKRSDRK